MDNSIIELSSDEENALYTVENDFYKNKNFIDGDRENYIQTTEDIYYNNYFSNIDMEGHQWLTHPDDEYLLATSQSVSDEIASQELDSNVPQRKINSSSYSKKMKIMKNVERSKKIAETEKIKQDKRIISNALKSFKPDQCLKNIVCLVDKELLSTDFGTVLINYLQMYSISYETCMNPYHHTVLWKLRNVQEISVVDGKSVVNTIESQDCEDLFLVVMWNEFVRLVYEDMLVAKFDYILTYKIPNKRVHLFVYGMEAYYKAHENKQKRKSKDKVYLEYPKISFQQVENILIKIQLKHHISHQFIETPENLALTLYQFTKAVAEKPYKLMQRAKQESIDWYVPEYNKRCIKVDKQGNGLNQLWLEQLSVVGMSLEVAAAIAKEYPTTNYLLTAYEKCTSVEQGETMLADIPVVRTGDPLAKAKRVGPEISKKVYIMYNSEDGTDYV